MSDEKIPTPDENAEPKTSAGATEESDGKKKLKVPKLYHNYISLAGGVIAVASLVCIVLLFLIELTSASDQPYLGILIYILGPAVMICGLIVFALGLLWERWRRRKMSPEEIAAYPILDLNGPKRRRAFIIFLFASFLFLFASAFGSFRAYEFTESVTFCGEVCHTVMKPEFVAYNATSHANVKCVECHVGGGAEWYLRSKFTGVRQLWGVITDNYNKPIQTPVHNMRPANDTCAKCHWSEKFYGDQLKVFNHYGYDENNSLNQTRMLIKVGGGNPETGQATGIHWHMNLGNEVTYGYSDEKRQDVTWVQMKNQKGEITQYTPIGSTVTSQQVEKSAKRKMDCIDCHNRPTHVYLSPNEALDDSFTAKRIDVSLPFVKARASETLSKPYVTSDEALKTIASDLDSYYKTSHTEIYSSKRNAINSAIVEVQRIYSTYFFPEMKTDWRAHANNIGHFNAQGCFRCHNGNFASLEGKKIRNDCNICHTTLDQTSGGTRITSQTGEFQHPAKLGELANGQCASCHTGNTAFEHPLNLGDISKFACAECHKGNDFKKVVAK